MDNVAGNYLKWERIQNKHLAWINGALEWILLNRFILIYSHTTLFNYLMCVVQWFSAYSQNCANISTI